jgi:hypothetical protein
MGFQPFMTYPSSQQVAHLLHHALSHAFIYPRIDANVEHLTRPGDAEQQAAIERLPRATLL